MSDERRKIESMSSQDQQASHFTAWSPSGNPPPGIMSSKDQEANHSATPDISEAPPPSFETLKEIFLYLNTIAWTTEFIYGAACFGSRYFQSCNCLSRHEVWVGDPCSIAKFAHDYTDAPAMAWAQKEAQLMDETYFGAEYSGSGEIEGIPKCVTQAFDEIKKIMSPLAKTLAKVCHAEHGEMKKGRRLSCYFGSLSSDALIDERRALVLLDD